MVASTKDDVATMLERMLVYGTKPYPHQLQQLGLDKRYLELVLERLRYRITSLPSHRPIKESLLPHTRSTEKPNYSEASWMDIPCLRLASKRESVLGNYYQEPLITRYSNPEMKWTADSRCIELFVTGNAQWVVCDAANMYDDGFSPIICKNVDELHDYFNEVTSSYWLYPTADAMFIRIANWILNTCRDEVDRLKQAVGYIEASINECDEVRSRFGYGTR